MTITKLRRQVGALEAEIVLHKETKDQLARDLDAARSDLADQRRTFKASLASLSSKNTDLETRLKLLQQQQPPPPQTASAAPSGSDAPPETSPPDAAPSRLPPSESPPPTPASPTSAASALQLLAWKTKLETLQNTTKGTITSLNEKIDSVRMWWWSVGREFKRSSHSPTTANQLTLRLNDTEDEKRIAEQKLQRVQGELQEQVGHAALRKLVKQPPFPSHPSFPLHSSPGG